MTSYIHCISSSSYPHLYTIFNFFFFAFLSLLYSRNCCVYRKKGKFRSLSLSCFFFMIIIYFCFCISMNNLRVKFRIVELQLILFLMCFCFFIFILCFIYDCIFLWCGESERERVIESEKRLLT